MEIQIKKTIKAGNSSAVILPKAWLNKEVRVELPKKTSETILCDVINILKHHIKIEEIVGVYLTGSYARNEEKENSDIDVLVVTDNIDKEMIEDGMYNILIISLDLLKQKLDRDLFPIGPMLKEARPLLNGNFLKKIEIAVTKKNIRWCLETTRDKLKLIKSSIERTEKIKPDGKLSDAIVYSLILRLRTIYIIDCLINKKEYTNNDFIRLTKKITGSMVAYNRYVYAKNHKHNQRDLPLNEGKQIYAYLKDYLEKISKSIK